MDWLMNIFLLMTIVSSKGKGTEYQSLYRRISEAYLKAIPQKVIENATVELCASHCAMEVEFECKSFDIDNRNRECHLHNHTLTEPLIGIQHAKGFDHYRTAYDRLFNRVPNHVISLRHKRNIHGLAVEECARRCILEMAFKCTGFDYESRGMNCWLTDQLVQDVNGLKQRSGIDFYERKTNGALGRFINFGYGSLQTVEGVQIHGKIVLGVNLDACAQLCLAETSFKCASFDYVFNEQSCQVSQYISANVHGMQTEFDGEHNVMHYELIGENLEFFYPTPYASILGQNDRTIKHVTPETCARKCLEERDFICRSFDYQIQKGTCLLSHVTGSDAGGLFTPDGVHVHHFEMKPSLDCGGILKEDRGCISSPNWPRPYTHHLNCTWSIEVLEFRIIRFEIYHLDIGYQTHEPCSIENDILAFTEYSEEGRQSRTCMENYQTQFTTSSNKAEVTFTTNAENDAQGFRMFYYTDWPCEATLTKDNGEISSPRWPSSYPALSNCHWHILAPNHSRIFLRFSSIELEDHLISNCRTAYDKIDIYDGNFTTSTLLMTLCGNRPPISVTSGFNSLYIVFTSDSRVQANGFHASYIFIHPTTTTIKTTTPLSSALTTKTSFFIKLNASSSNKDLVPEQTVPSYGKDEIKTNVTSNSSVSVQMAMISDNSEDKKTDELSAIFVEPGPDDFHEPRSDSNATLINTGKTSDDIGRDEAPDYDIVHPEKNLNSIVLGVFAAFILLLLVLTATFLLICRYYRRRIPKLRPGSNIQHPEENMSLCHSNRGLHEQEEFKDEDDIDDAARLPLPGDHRPVPDIEFHNPLYNRNRSVCAHTLSEHASNVTSLTNLSSSLTHLKTLESISDVNTSNTDVSQTLQNLDSPYMDGVFSRHLTDVSSDLNETGVSPTESKHLAGERVATRTQDESSSQNDTAFLGNVYIDCFTTI